MNKDIKSIRDHIFNDDFVSAGRLIDSVSDKFAKSPIFLAFKAIYYFKIGNVDVAISLMADAAEKLPHDWAVFYNLAYWLYLKGHFKASEEAIAKSIRVSPFNPVAYFLRAQIFTSQGRHSEAMMSLYKSIELDNLFYPSYVSLTNYLILDDHVDLAEKLYEDALKADPDNKFFNGCAEAVRQEKTQSEQA